MSTFNKKIAESLGIDIPPTETDPMLVPVVVEPHEIVSVENTNLPPMADIDSRLLEGEKQLELIIQSSLDQVVETKEQIAQLEPKYRGRFVDAANATLTIALEAVKTKIATQMDKKDMRMKEAEFKGGGGQKTAGGGNTTNNIIFSGSRDDFLKAIQIKMSEGDDK